MAPASGEQPGAAPSAPSPTATTIPPPPFHPFAAHDASAATREDDHPLIAFRRFADAQLAALLHGFVGLPSSALDENPSATPWEQFGMEDGEHPAQDEQQRSRRNRWRGRDREDRCMRHHHRHQRHRHQHAEQEDAESSDPLRSAHAAMLTHYLLNDAYSPLALEADPVLSRINWRAAFTELVADTPADSSDARSTPSSQPPREWAVSTAQRWARYRPTSGSTQGGFVIGFPSLHALHAPWDRGLADTMHGQEHGPSLRGAVSEKMREQARKTESHHPPSPPQPEPHTELDMYERFLDGVRPGDSPRRRLEAGTQTEPAATGAVVLRAEKPETTSPPPPKATPQTPEPLHREPGLVATLTTTEQVLLPDGTTHTKVALKKRFSDGREERKETVHMSHGEQERERDWVRVEPGNSSKTPNAPEAKPNVSVTQELAKETKRSRGWFWS